MDAAGSWVSLMDKEELSVGRDRKAAAILAQARQQARRTVLDGLLSLADCTDQRPLMLFALLACAIVITAVDLLFGVREFRGLRQQVLRLERLFRIWSLRLVLLYGVGALVALALIGRLDAITSLPPEFVLFAPSAETDDAGGVVIIIGAIVLGAGIASLIAARLKKADAQVTPQSAVVSSLVPRSSSEKIWAAIVSINAGVCEEIFFRLMLPLLFVLVLGNVVAAFVLSAMAFGSIHAYQGWKGVAATTIVGAGFTVMYVVTRSLWVVMAVHMAIDLNALLLQPWLRERVVKR
jgi:uncharacterized protein